MLDPADGMEAPAPKHGVHSVGVGAVALACRVGEARVTEVTAAAVGLQACFVGLPAHAHTQLGAKHAGWLITHAPSMM